MAVPGSVVLVAGGAQRAAAGATLPQAVVVRVLSTRGRPIAQTAVRFRSADGRSAFDPTTAVTDADGRARTTWTLGDAPGRQRLLADVDHVDSALAVVAEADPVAANTRAAAINDQQSARAGERLPQPVAVRLSDTTGRPLVDVPVAWVALDGGIVKTLEARTDSLGDARAEWTLAPRAGAQHVRALIGGTRTVPPVVLTAVAGAGAPAAASLVSGDGQHGTAGAPLAKPLVLRVVDRTGNPVPGVRVTVRPKTGTVADTTLETDSAGTAAVRWTLAQAAGGQRLSIRAEGVARPVDATAVAAPDVPANVDFGPAPDAGVVGRALGERISVTVTDQYGNAIASAPVVFTTRVGSATPTRVATDAAGRAATRWTLGPTPGEESLVAAVRGTDARATLTVRAEVPGAKTAKPSRTAPSTKPTAAAKVAKPVAAPLAKKVTPHRGR
jgi:hypothetical protein